MKKIALSIALLAALLAGCRNDKKEAASDSDVINIIMETDIGNDVDDALSNGPLYKYLDEGKSIFWRSTSTRRDRLPLNMLTYSTPGTVIRRFRSESYATAPTAKTTPSTTPRQS